MTMAQLTIMVLTKIYGIMKKVNRIFLPLAMVIPFVACNKEEVINPSNDGTLHIDVVAAVEDLANAADTKTYINGTDILWGTNEQMEIALIDPTDATKGTFKSSEATSEFDGKAQATFSFNVTMETEPASFIYGGVYPYNNGIDNTNPSAYKVSLPEIQNATAESYDPAAYILVAKAESFAEAQTTWMASFKRATALNKITLTNLEDGITSVEIILPEDAVIAGRRYIDLSTGALGEIYYNETNSIRVNYATALSAASKDIWFTSWNAEVPAGANITIKAYSETATYTHTITAREEGISFSISISDIPTIKLLQEKFPNSVVPIYIQGQKFEDFAKANQDDQTEYMQEHLSGYHTSYQSYCEHITDYANVVINDGDITDLSKQILLAKPLSD